MDKGPGTRKITGKIFLFLLVLGPWSMVHGPVFAAEIPRTILAFYDPKVQSDYNYSAIHLNAEMPLEHLGLKLEYRSIADPFPSAQEMTGVRGIFTWFKRLNAVPNPGLYCNWMQGQILKGKKVVFFGEIGVLKDENRRLTKECRAMLEALGIEYGGGYSGNPLFYDIVYKDPSMIEFERKFSFAESHENIMVKALSPASKVYLKIKRRDLDNKTTDVVFTTPRGGFAPFNTMLYEDKEIEKIHWRINPFRFFEEAFGTKGLPRPDTTTRNGSRIFYTHIDGDGVVNLSHIDWKSFSGEIILKEILEKMPHLPVTASLITGYFDMNEYKSERVMRLYRDIFRLPNVEAGVHTYAHPLNWSRGTVALKIPGYKFNPEKETVGSAKMMQEMLDAQGVRKKVGILLWSGNCVVNDLEVGLTYQNNLLNINGGDTRFDRRYDSYASVGPLGIKRGFYHQIYASAQNENTYTNLWEGPYYGFVDVIETFKNTEAPLRIKPINVYYHFYSGERQASLKALKAVYDYAFLQDIFPMFAEDFVRIAQGFYKTRMEAVAGGYKITNSGALKTVRFDDEKKHVDMRRSRGVLGFAHHQGSLYVALDASSEEQTIILTHSKSGIPYVARASFNIKGFQGTRERLQFSKSGWFKSEMILGGMQPLKNYKIRAGEETLQAKSGNDGRLTLQFKNAENGPQFTDVIIESL
ncbi:MAG: hypothetical protein Q8P84_00315 [Deltaproteobacteria bacterium]|nr:hypothetical protein [Deltaproteobacteria bacterium]